MAPSLDAATIAEAAVTLADGEGVEAVSMRRLGAELGVSAMALYRHVADREDLVRRMVGHIAAKVPPLPEGDVPWRDSLTHLADTTFAAFEQHPWLLDVALSPTRLIDATSAAGTENALGRLIEAGCTPERAADVLLAVAALPVGIARVTIGTAPSRPVDYADAAAPGPLTTTFRSAPLGADRGRRVLATALRDLLDGTAASLSHAPSPTTAAAHS